MNDKYSKEELMDLLDNVDIKKLNYNTLKLFNTITWLITEINRLETELLLKESEK